MEDNNIEEKIKNLEEWNSERDRIKPFLDAAVDYHSKARREAYWKNYEKAAEFFKRAIESYKTTLQLNPKYYFQDVMERVDSVLGEYINNAFHLKADGDKLDTEKGIKEFVKFIEDMSAEEKKYIDPYELALAYFKIAEVYYEKSRADIYYEENNIDKAYEFYNKVISLQCERPFINRDAYLRMGRVLFYKKRFKEALIDFVSSLFFDRGNAEAVDYLDRCLAELKISEHRYKFLFATPNEAKKLVMEVL